MKQQVVYNVAKLTELLLDSNFKQNKKTLTPKYRRALKYYPKT